jgi:hypothetical protein
VHKCGSGRADASARDLPQGFQYGRNSKLGVLPGRVPRKTDKVDLNNDTLWRSYQFQAHRLVDDPEVALKERQRVAEVLRAWRDIEKDPSIARAYFDTNFALNGFLRTPDGTITSFDPPGSTFTFPSAINPAVTSWSSL